MKGPNGCCEDCGVNEDGLRQEGRIEGWRQFRDDLQATLGASSVILQGMWPGAIIRFSIAEVAEVLEKLRMPQEWD